MTGSEVGERKYERSGKRPRTREHPKNKCAICLYAAREATGTNYLRTLFIETNILVIIFFL